MDDIGAWRPAELCKQQVSKLLQYHNSNSKRCSHSCICCFIVFVVTVQKSSCPGKSPISPRCMTVQPAVNVISNRMQCDQLSSSSGNVLSAFRLTVDNSDINLQQQQQLSASVNTVCGMRNSLLVAADSVTDAMSSLVRELNSGIDSTSTVAS